MLADPHLSIEHSYTKTGSGKARGGKQSRGACSNHCDIASLHRFVFQFATLGG
jgi:hypothetical protein